MINDKANREHQCLKRIVHLTKKLAEEHDDGRLNITAAKKILKELMDSNLYFDAENKIVSVISKKFNWTDDGYQWFSIKVRKWSATR